MRHEKIFCDTASPFRPHNMLDHPALAVLGGIECLIDWPALSDVKPEAVLAEKRNRKLSAEDRARNNEIGVTPGHTAAIH